MLAHARLKLKNAERSIAFIQEQHTRTLQGLHYEIQKLQQKNAHLTFELAVQGSTPQPSGCSDCGKYSEELQTHKSEVISLQSALSACKEEKKLLKHQLRDAEFTFSEEISQREVQINQLESELERKSQLIAHLTKQLHQMKVEFTRLSETNSSLMQSVAVVPGSVADFNYSQRAGPEHPDIDIAMTSRISRRVRRATASALPHDPDTFQKASQSHEKQTRRSLPTHTSTPPISPRPPSTSPPQRFLRRASRVSHRSARPANVTRSPNNVSRTPQSTTSLHSLDPVQLQKQAPDITDLLLQRNENSSNICVIAKPSPPVLPPIATNSSSSVVSDTMMSSGGRVPEPQPYPARRSQHGPVILARSQGLSSAPREGEGDVGEGERKTAAAAGMLLVKEETHNQKNQAWQELHQSGSD